jgi:HAE1 family hydrophobic/amphiphilic exporter-1
MLTKLTAAFVHRPTLVFVMLALVSMAGVMAWRSIPQQQFPNVVRPTVTINASYSGASTTVMRDSVVAPIEDLLAGTPDLTVLNSVVQTGTARISATFDLNSDINTDLVNVQKAVQAAQRRLPTAVLAPTIQIADPSESVVAELAIRSTKLSESQLSLLVTGRIAPALQQIPGVSNVGLSGNVTPAYEVRVDPAKLAADGLTLTDVIGAVSSGNVLAPGGIAYGATRETQIAVRGDIQSPASILGLPLPPPPAAGPTNAAIAGTGLSGLPGAVNPWTASTALRRVGDVASVVDGSLPHRQHATVNGVQSILLSIQKTSTASEVTSSNAVLAALPSLRHQFPDVQFSIVNVQSKFTQQQLDGVIRTLLEGVLLTGIVMLFFLHSWRNAIVVCVAIPTSLAVALFMMKVFGMTIDTVSLLGMTLVIGILVDDSTVVLENIERHHEMGQAPEEAAITGRGEIGMAAIVITLVDVVIFLPIAFMPGQIGRQLYEFGAVVTIATLTSLVVSFTVTPTLAGLWALKSHWQPPRVMQAFTAGFERLRTWYADRALPWALRHQWQVVTFSLLSFVGALLMVSRGAIGAEFLPPQDRGEIFLQVQYPVGTPLTTTYAGISKLENAVRTSPDLLQDTAVSGIYQASFGGSVAQGNVGQIHVYLKDNRLHSTDYWVTQYQAIAAKVLPNAQTLVVPATSTGGGNAQPIDYLVNGLSGTDPNPTAVQVAAVLKATPGAVSVNTSASSLSPQVDVVFDRQRMQALDVNLATAANAAAAAFGGAIATQFETPDGLEQVQVIYPLADQTNLAAIGAIPVRAANGGIVHLSDFATLSYTPSPPLITRINRNTVVHVNANLAPGVSLQTVQNAFQPRLAALHLPPNVTVTAAQFGQQDFLAQTLSGMGQSLILSVVLVFLLMVALYNSYRSPLIILFSVPVAAVGAVGALWLTHQTLNLFSLIGTILLVGIATKNGILLVDYANTLRRRGLDELSAIRESAYTRFRPIVMTSVSVIAGNLPLALALEPGSNVRSSLGVVVIGGQVSALVLTLLLVPIMYLHLAPKKLPGQEPTPDPHGVGTSLPSGAAVNA